MLVNQCWLQDLRRVHADSKWPDMLNTPLLKAARATKAIEFMECEYYQTSVVYYPAICAAIAMGEIKVEDYIRMDTNAIYEMKKLRDFDRDWFSSAFSYFASAYQNQKKGNEK